MSARERILDAAARIMRERGVTKATTREIARTAGYSEALLYKHFRDKEEIMIAVLRERMPALRTAAAPGEGTVAGNLAAVADAAVAFYRLSFPMMASMAADPALVASARTAIGRYTAGPREPLLFLTGYLDAERDLGRVRADADTAGVAALLMGACFQQGFLAYFSGEDGHAPELPGALVAGVLPALLP
ncbi:TetR/AcrR family transcriptional regulator [Actinomadura atramentaria]|uniref:TetR/AcrR family transcriptional regulator n=1 Tax=Actinomadura atramentaria TaxID=1990 RepID=UPI000376A900|nr:TetR/AcrR family transcriptional regulator [Actinomadura atramentaria]